MHVPHLLPDVTIDPSWLVVAVIAGICIGYLIKVRDKRREHDRS